MGWRALTLDALGMVLDENNIAMLLSCNDRPHASRLDVLPSLSGILGLHDDHVPTVTSLVEQTTSCSSSFEG